MPVVGAAVTDDEVADTDAKRLLGFLALFVVAYFAMVIGTNVFLDTTTSFEGRLLLPVQFTAGLLVIGLVHRVLVNRAGTVIAAVAVIVVLVWCAWPGREDPAAVREVVDGKSAIDDGYLPAAPLRDRGGGRQAPEGRPARLQRPGGHISPGWSQLAVPAAEGGTPGGRYTQCRVPPGRSATSGRIFAAGQGYIVLYDDPSPALAGAADLRRYMGPSKP